MDTTLTVDDIPEFRNRWGKDKINVELKDGYLSISATKGLDMVS